MTSKTFHSVYNQIRAKILLSGPITVADYMKMALTIQPASSSTGKGFSSSGGYYMERDVFGEEGDFITSPEISQLFGEMMGVWGIDTWRRIGGPKHFNIVELGPGRGTLAKDMLRVFHQLNNERDSMKLHLVEISPYLAKVQFETLCRPIGRTSPISYDDTSGNKGQSMEIDPMREGEINSPFYQGVTNDVHEVPVFWHRHLQSVPKGFNLYIAHEFFDTLPIHKLQRIDNTWKEILVDILPEEGAINTEVTAIGDTRSKACLREEERGISSEKFRFVISRHETPVIQLLKSYYPSLLTDKNRSQFEFSIDGAQICEELTQRLEEDGGIVLLVDYGHDGTKGDTFRGFHRHKLHDPLESPGLVDLTADVDFSILGQIAQKKALVCGPITQAEFLSRVGVEVRMANLHCRCKTEGERRQLLSGYKMLMDDMGKRFKCLALLPKVLEEFRPKLKITAFDN